MFQLGPHAIAYLGFLPIPLCSYGILLKNVHVDAAIELNDLG